MESEDNETRAYIQSITSPILHNSSSNDTHDIPEKNQSNRSCTVTSPSNNLTSPTNNIYISERSHTVSSPSIDLHDTSSHSRTSNRFRASPSDSVQSQAGLPRPVPLHPTKKARLSAKSDEQLAETCIQSAQQITNLLKSRLTQQAFGDCIAQDLEELDKDLQNIARQRINTTIFEIKEIQHKRNNDKLNKNK